MLLDTFRFRIGLMEYTTGTKLHISHAVNFPISIVACSLRVVLTTSKSKSYFGLETRALNAPRGWGLEFSVRQERWNVNF